MSNTMDEFCRGCLNNFNDPSELLQYTEESRRLFVYSTGLQVKRNDLFTFQLCRECYFSMKTSCKFKKMCRTSDRKIKSYLALKDVDEGMDFSSFLKKHEESLTFRLPLLSGGTTPANQKSKDDDNESTCTSIQNFMTDILKEEEIPDSEARIIWEVIKEEADVLEDSLDSHWLQDDVSVDSNFQNLSLSQFSTPQTTNDNRMVSSGPREVTSDITSGEDYDNIPIDSTLKKTPAYPVDSSYELQKVLSVGMNDTNNRCVIDKNLENALRNENNKEISLQELLVSPSGFHNTSGASTPTINNILFGENLNVIKKVKSPIVENDVDLLINKLDNNKSSREDIHSENFNFNKLIPAKEKDKCDFKKLLMGNDLEENLKVDKPKLVQIEKDDFKMNTDSLQGENLDLEESKLLLNIKNTADINTKRMQEGKIDLLGKLFMGMEHKDLDKINVRKMQSEQSEKSHDELCMKDLNIGLLLDDKVENSEMNSKKILNIKLEIGNINAKKLQKATPIKTLGKGFDDEDTADEILKEFLDNDERKSCIGKKQKEFPRPDSVAQIDDAELTELLEDSFILNKGKKIDIQSSDKINIKKPLKSQPCIGKQMKYSLENKYCVTNFYCKMCEKKFDNLKNLKGHFLNCHKYRIQLPKQHSNIISTCHICGKSFTQTKSYKIHMKNHKKPEAYHCVKCSNKFKTESALNNHMTTHGIALPVHMDSTPKYICTICGAQTSSASNFVTHKRRHLKNYTMYCDECGKGFYRKNELEVHLRSHTGEKPFSCNICDKSFARRDTLNRHYKLHTEEKLFECHNCDRKFARKYDLKIHTCKIKI